MHGESTNLSTVLGDDSHGVVNDTYTLPFLNGLNLIQLDRLLREMRSK